MKKINGFEDYLIFDDGRIYSTKSDIFMSITVNKGTGYGQVGLSNNGVVKTFQTHRLVANHYIPNPENKPQINHINGNKMDNRVENLEWVTDSENKLHAYSSGLKCKNAIAKPVVQICKDTKKILNLFPSANKASRITGINQGNISNCCLGRCKSVGGYIWKYEFDVEDFRVFG